MKKFLCGVAVLLAAVGFTSCNKSSDTDDITIVLNNGATELTINPNQESRISVKAEGYTGKDKLTYTWSSSNEKIATVDKNGTVKGIALGDAKITCTTVISKQEFKAELAVSVKSKIETVRFTQASISYSYDQETNKPVEDRIYSDTVVVATVTWSGQKVYGLLIGATVNIFSEGFGYDDNGKLTGPETGYTISFPGYILYADYGMNPELKLQDGTLLFNKEGEHTTWTLGAWETFDDKEANGLVGGKVKDEAAYITHVKAAIDAYNKDDISTCATELGNAAIEGFEGGQLFSWTNYEEYGYLPTIMPLALAKEAKLNIESGSAKYMYAINGFNITAAPLDGAEVGGENIGMEAEMDDVTEKLTLKGTKINFGKDIVYHEAKNSETQSAPARGMQIRSFSNSELQMMKKNLGANAPMLPVNNGIMR